MKQAQHSWQFKAASPNLIDVQNIVDTLTRKTPVAVCTVRDENTNQPFMGFIAIHDSVRIKYEAMDNNGVPFKKFIWKKFKGPDIMEKVIPMKNCTIVNLGGSGDVSIVVDAIREIMQAPAKEKLPCICVVSYPKI